MKSENFITGVFVGAIAGLAAGILLAPDKGSETRQKIIDKGGDLASKVKNKVSGHVDDAEKMLNKAGNKTEDWSG
ncbi:MAG: YtxH domain-containing protein [Bacteroidota bacterium]|nr:YtxH domain-containing protein [Bacteroidota bacterium]